jgi:hypothetical protein
MEVRLWAARLITGFVLVWPLVHYPMVRAFELSAWRFGGFAMYATLRPLLQARDPMLGEAGGPLKAIPVERLPAGVRERVLDALAAGMQRRDAYGSFYDAAAEAEVLFELSPSANVAVVSIERCWLDAEAFVACNTLRYTCSRPSNGPPRCLKPDPQPDPG